MTTQRRPLLVGFDGSPGAVTAIELAAKLLPGRDARIVHLWAPPFAAPELRVRLRRTVTTLQEMIDLLEHEAQADAERTAAHGVTLANAAGWRAEPLLRRVYGGEGLELAALAEKEMPEALVVGARGLAGARAVLGSVSDEAIHSSPVPVLVVPRYVFTTQRSAASAGPIVVGDDGSEGASGAFRAAGELFAGRELIRVHATYLEDELPDPSVVTVELEGSVASGRGVADALAREARVAGAAAIVVGSRGRSAAREILLGSAAMATVHHADRPVVVVPTTRRRAGG